MMPILKQWIKAAFRKLGFEVIRIRREPVDEKEELSADERADWDGAIDSYFESHVSKGWYEARSIKAYLSDDRILFYKHVIGICEEEGVQFDGRSVADVGCGAGGVLRLLGQRHPAACLHGLDVNEPALPLAQHLCPSGEFRRFNICEAPAGRYDVVMATEMLEHILQPGDALRGLVGMVNPGGVLVLTVPNGRRGTMRSGKLMTHGTAYSGHINFWSPENWPLFLARVCPSAVLKTGTFAEELHLYAVLRLPGEGTVHDAPRIA